MATVLSKSIITSAKETISTYTTAAKQQYDSLNAQIEGLIGSGFVGEAADGYKTFFTQKIVPALTTYLTDGDTSLMHALDQMLSDIEAQLIGNVDPELGNANRGAGGND